MRLHQKKTNRETAEQIVQNSTYSVVSMTDLNGHPYCIPVNLALDGETAYFHCAMEGQKLDILSVHPEVCISCVDQAAVQPEKYSTYYRSALIYGKASFVHETDEKMHALKVICSRFTPDHMHLLDGWVKAQLDKTCIIRIDVDHIDGKQNPAQN